MIKTLAALTIFLGFTANAQVPISWNNYFVPDLEGADSDQIEAALAKGNISPLPLDLSKGSEIVRAISDCNQYVDLKSRGFEPISTVSLTMESYFVQRCETLQFLKKAAASSETFLGSVVTKDSLREFPICFGEIGGDSGFWEINNQRTLNGDSLDPADWSSIAINGSYLEISAPGEIRSFAYSAFGDINGDGFEDALVLSSTAYIEATARMYSAYRVTRVNRQAKVLKILKQKGPSLNSVVYGCPETF